MGQSTDAILFYGLCWDKEDCSKPWTIGEDEDEDEDADDEDDGADRRLALRSGVKPPSQKFPDKGRDANGMHRTDYTPAEQAIVDEYSAYWEAQRKVNDDCPVECGTHCYYECPMPYVAVKASVTTANRGCPEEITSLEVKSEWDEQLRAYCALMGIPWQEPKWWLVSDWN